MSKLKSKTKIIILCCLIAVISVTAVGAAILIYGSKAPPAPDFTLTAVENGETVLLFSKNGGLSRALAVQTGQSCTVTAANLTEDTIQAEIAADNGQLSLTALTLAPGESTGIQLTTETEGTILFSVAVFSENEIPLGMICDAAALIRLSGDARISGGHFRLGADLTVDELNMTVPFTLTLNKHSLTVTGELIFNCESTGKMTVTGTDMLFASAIYIDAPLWDLVFDTLPGILDGEDAAYYVRAKTLNGTAFDGSNIPVSSRDKFERLLDNKKIPRLLPGSTLRLEGDYALGVPYGEFDINCPVSLIVGRGINTDNANIFINTRQNGNIHITASQSDFIMLDTPLSNVTWDGGGQPDAHTVFSYMNVASYNGETADPRMGGPGTEKLLSIRLTKENNTGLLEPLTWEVNGNCITAYLEYTFPEALLKNIKPDFSVTGGDASFLPEFTSANGAVDLSRDAVCIVTDKQGEKRSYLVHAVWRTYELPTVSITTRDGAAITSKDTYISGNFSMTVPGEGGMTAAADCGMQIRGRGNSTWKWLKKPYKIKLDKKVEILGMEAAKDWVLLANYADKSLIRNHTALDIGRVLDKLDFVPHSYPVDLFVNGVYAGVYSIGEHIETKPGRVLLEESDDADDVGFLLELGGRENDVHVSGRDYFTVGNLRNALVCTPSLELLTPSQMSFITNYARKADAAVKALDGYDQYIDIPSLIDWFLLHELCYNLDSSFRRSCFLTKQPGGKLKMGPPWDFDLALGNFSKDAPKYDNWASVGSSDKDAYVKITWMNDLLTDPAFTSRLKIRWAEVGEKMLKAGLQSIAESRKTITASADQNFKVWNILGKVAAFESRQNAYFKTHEEHLTYIENFLKSRKSWMDKAISSMYSQ